MLFWLFGFVVAFVPGVIIGGIIGRYCPSKLLCIFVALVIGVFGSSSIYPDPSVRSHFENLIGFFPPLLAVLLVGHCFGHRRRKRAALAAPVA